MEKVSISSSKKAGAEKGLNDGNDSLAKKAEDIKSNN